LEVPGESPANHTADYKGLSCIIRKWIIDRPYGRQYHRDIGGFLRIR
jgi:hypothetical protein